MAKAKQDPTVKSADVDASRPIEQAADWAGNKEYAENPDKPHPSTVAQVEVLPEDK